MLYFNKHFNYPWYVSNGTVLNSTLLPTVQNSNQAHQIAVTYCSNCGKKISMLTPQKKRRIKSITQWIKQKTSYTIQIVGLIKY